MAFQRTPTLGTHQIPILDLEDRNNGLALTVLHALADVNLGPANFNIVTMIADELEDAIQ